MKNRIIPFSPPDITRAEIDELVDTLRSGWITTGPKTKQFEKEIAKYCNTKKAVCLNSATAGLELVLRLFDIGVGDEVITTPYTFAATANVILHVGAKPVFVDIKKDQFNIDPKEIERAITKKTKAVITVDFGGFPCDYDEILDILENNKRKYCPKKHTNQQLLEKPLFLADTAHSFGAEYKGKKIGGVADFSVFSFHAVKNLATAEGGAVTFNSLGNIDNEHIYNKLMLLSLHGQSKDALAKSKAGSWKYTIECAGYKYNMTDITASLGLVQLRRYDKELLIKRKKSFNLYNDCLSDDIYILPPFISNDKKSSYHLFPLRIREFDEKKRDKLISRMAEKGIATNVHYIPLVMQPLYKKLGYSINNYPNAYNMYKNEITLPLYSLLKEGDIIYICDALKKFTKL